MKKARQFVIVNDDDTGFSCVNTIEEIKKHLESLDYDQARLSRVFEISGEISFDLVQDGFRVEILNG